MRCLLTAASMVALSATLTMAQDATWTGAYGGLSMARSTGSHDYGAAEYYDLDGPTYGAFGGYMWGNGALVYGVELAFTRGGVYESEPGGGTSYEDEYEYDRFLDLKGRIGYSAGNALIYGTLGVSQTQFNAYIGQPTEANTTTSGVIYGLGADYKLGSRFFVGAEYLRRNFSFHEAAQVTDIDAEINTIALRIGMTF